jgi:SAM-dependent methyltransferase
MGKPEEDRERVACIICHVRDVKRVFPAAGGLARSFPLVQCKRCGLVFQEWARTLEELDDAQQGAYGERQRRFISPVELGVHLFCSLRVHVARSLLPPGGRVLDVGCGRGVFLRMLHERGYEVRGTELSAATAANADPGVRVDVGELHPGMYNTESFDLIWMWHVLEHMRRPDLALRAAWEALVPGGALLVALPNFASVEARLGREGWFHLDLPRHIFHFTPETLRRLLDESGFVLSHCRTGQWDMDPFSLLQSVLNRMGFRQNALYDTLRNNPAVKHDLSMFRRASLLALFPVGMFVAFPFSLVFRLAGCAGTIVVGARKPATGPQPL